MPMIRARYPEDWEVMAERIKTGAAWSCESCGRPCRRPGESLPSLEGRVSEWGDAYRASSCGNHRSFASAKFKLTVAHLDHDPTNSDPENLKAWCTPCHARYDIRPEALARKRYLRAEWEGQLPLDLNLYP